VKRSAPSVGTPFYESRGRLCARGRLRAGPPAGFLKRMSFIAVAAAVAVAGVMPSYSGPYTPADDAQALERLPTAGNQKLRELRKAHAELARNPGELARAVRVATQDIEAARAESDPRYNGYAEAALGPWLALPDPPNPVLLLRAILRQATHDFSGALNDLNRVISADPRNLQARLTRAIILQVQGEYPEALKNCLSLALFAENLVTTTCIASVSSLHGQARASHEALQGALDATSPDESLQIRLWALTILAEIEVRLGDLAAAEQHFRQAMSLGARDGYLLGAYADLLLDAGPRGGPGTAAKRNANRRTPVAPRVGGARTRDARPVAPYLRSQGTVFDESATRRHFASTGGGPVHTAFSKSGSGSFATGRCKLDRPTRTVGCPPIARSGAGG
jgi:tetratricopeptide (TPR) repeat protein